MSLHNSPTLKGVKLNCKWLIAFRCSFCCFVFASFYWCFEVSEEHKHSSFIMIDSTCCDIFCVSDIELISGFKASVWWKFGWWNVGWMLADKTATERTSTTGCLWIVGMMIENCDEISWKKRILESFIESGTRKSWREFIESGNLGLV
jgi:hypothetical protein